MARIGASGTLNIESVRTTLGLGTGSRNLNSLRSGNDAGYTPPSGEMSLGHMYGAFNLGPAQISSDTTINTGNFGVTSSAPNISSGGTNPGNGTYLYWPGSNGYYTASYPSTGDNIRFYARILPYQVPWAGAFEAPANNALGIGASYASWPGYLEYTIAVWGTNINTGTWFSSFPALGLTALGPSACNGLATISGSQYWGCFDRAQFKTGSYSILEAYAMFGLSSFARNSQQNTYFRFGGPGITSLTIQYNELIYRGYGYNHDSTNIGPGSHYSPNNFGFLKNQPGVTFPGSHNGPGGGTTWG
jgi:hypothetical protein